jgi:hypothetical protein
MPENFGNRRDQDRQPTRQEHEENWLRKKLEDFNKVLAIAEAPKKLIENERKNKEVDLHSGYISALTVVSSDKFPSVTRERKQSLIDRIAETGDAHLSWAALNCPLEYIKLGTRDILVDNIVASGNTSFALGAYRQGVDSGLNEQLLEKLKRLASKDRDWRER